VTLSPPDVALNLDNKGSSIPTNRIDYIWFPYRNNSGKAYHNTHTYAYFPNVFLTIFHASFS
jgi:hypothetical protein